jgi:predicted ester cyclase
MNKMELVKSAFDLDNGDRWSFYSDNFQWTDSVGSPPRDKSSFFAMEEPMRLAFPDLSLVIEDIREEGDGVVVTTHFYGTFTNDLDLSFLGVGAIPATGRAVTFPSGTDLVSFENGKISKLHGLDTGPDGGLPGFLKALGVKTG